MIKQTVHWIFRGIAAAAVALLVAVGSVQAQVNPPPRTPKPVTGGSSSTVAPYLNLSTASGAAQVISDANSITVFTELFNPADETFGGTLVPISDVLRAQLNVPAGQGVLVESLRGDGPCALAGLKQYDVLLTLADKPLASADDLTKHLKAAGEAPVPLKLLRGGKRKTIQVRPNYRVTLAPVGEDKKEYFLGISLGSIDEALRSQLALSAGQGVIITEVVKESPAEKAGVKPHDVVLELGDKAVESSEKLAAQVQADQDKPTTLKVLRAGKPLSIAITPAVREVKTDAAAVKAAIRFLAVAQDDEIAQRARKVAVLRRYEQVYQERESSKQIEDLRDQVRALQQAVEKLNATLNNTPPIPPKK
jgi:C-terminal processing protease CtpA/Prc